MSARDGESEAMLISEHWISVFFLWAVILWRESCKTFADIPSVILAWFNERHFFVLVLSDISHPQVTGEPVKTEPPRLAETDGPGLGPYGGISSVSLEIRVI